jgi:hypothetical protein
MDASDIHVTIICGFMTAFGLPTLGALWRISGRLATGEEKLRELTEDLSGHIADDKAVREELLATIREDRKANNDRLTYLERLSAGSRT